MNHMEISSQKNIKSKKRATRALVLFSGGLDSVLAVKILEAQEIEVTALAYASYFFDAEQAKKTARENNINLVIKDISPEHLEVVKKPKFLPGIRHESLHRLSSFDAYSS